MLESCYHIESLQPENQSCVGCIDACLERKGRGGYGVKPVLGICLVERNEV